MPKEKASKLDPFAERLDEWFGIEHKTIAEVQKQLALDGCSVSSGRLSTWWEARQRQRMSEALLGQIASGADQCKAVEREFGRNPAPEMETLIKLHRVLILKLATAGNVEPELLKLADQLMRTAMEYISGQTKFAQKERELKLAEDKFEFNAAKQALAAVTELKTISASKLSDVEKIDAARRALFGELPEDQAKQA